MGDRLLSLYGDHDRLGCHTVRILGAGQCPTLSLLWRWVCGACSDLTPMSTCCHAARSLGAGQCPTLLLWLWRWVWRMLPIANDIYVLPHCSLSESRAVPHSLSLAVAMGLCCMFRFNTDVNMLPCCSLSESRVVPQSPSGCADESLLHVSDLTTTSMCCHTAQRLRAVQCPIHVLWLLRRFVACSDLTPLMDDC